MLPALHPPSAIISETTKTPRDTFTDTRFTFRMLGPKSRKTVKLEAFQRPCGWSIPAATTKIDWVAGILSQFSIARYSHSPASPNRIMAAIAGLAKFEPPVWRKTANLFIENAIDLRSSSIRTTHIQG
jgi:hypothetical protein